MSGQASDFAIATASDSEEINALQVPRRRVTFSCSAQHGGDDDDQYYELVCRSIYIDHNIVGNFATIAPAISQSGANVIINLGGYGAIQLNNTSAAGLGADDFVFY